MNLHFPEHLGKKIREQRPWLPKQNERLRFGGHGSDSTADDQLLDMWTRPNSALTGTWDILSYALTVNGYEFYDMIVCAEDHSAPGLFEFAKPIIEHFRRTGRFEGSFSELRLALFIQQRIIRNDEQCGHDDESDRDTNTMLRGLNTAICEAWTRESSATPT